MSAILTTYGTGFPCYSREILLNPYDDLSVVAQLEALALSRQLDAEDLPQGSGRVVAEISVGKGTLARAEAVIEAY